jgi:hypothetical protein
MALWLAIQAMKFSTSLIKLNGSFLSQRKFRVSVEDEMSTTRVMQAGVLQGSVLSPTLVNMYINNAPRTSHRKHHVFATNTNRLMLFSE